MLIFKQRNRGRVRDLVAVQIKQVERALTGEQFYLREFERHSLIVATAEARDDRPQPVRLNDDAEFDYEGEDNV